MKMISASAIGLILLACQSTVVRAQLDYEFEFDKHQPFLPPIRSEEFLNAAILDEPYDESELNGHLENYKVVGQYQTHVTHPDDYGSESGQSAKYTSAGKGYPINTFVKTDKDANFKWGVRYRAGDGY